MAGQLIHEVIPVGLLQCNCSILGDQETGEAIVVDPGDEIERIEEALRAHKLRVRAILSTHTHIDHVGGLALLHRATGAPVLIHRADLDLYQMLELQAQWLGIPTPAVMNIKDFVKEGDTVAWGRFAAGILHTPGHTPGSISLVVKEHAGSSGQENAGGATAQREGSQIRPQFSSRLIAGDTLFKGSIGRTDLWGGSFPRILSSIKEKLLTLPENMIVYPGHGELTTIGQEREHNPFLR